MFAGAVGAKEAVGDGWVEAVRRCVGSKVVHGWSVVR